MKEITLIRAIKDASGENDLKIVKVKEESELTAFDFYDVEVDTSGKMKLGNMASAIANVCNLTEGQVASMHPKDYIMLSAEVGKYIE